MRPWGRWDRAGLIFLALALAGLAVVFYQLLSRLLPLLLTP